MDLTCVPPDVVAVELTDETWLIPMLVLCVWWWGRGGSEGCTHFRLIFGRTEELLLEELEEGAMSSSTLFLTLEIRGGLGVGLTGGAGGRAGVGARVGARVGAGESVVGQRPCKYWRTPSFAEVATRSNQDPSDLTIASCKGGVHPFLPLVGNGLRRAL